MGIYTWNERTNKLDAISTNVGIEVVGFFVRSVVYVQTTISDFWNNYVSLVSVNEENEELKEELFQIKRELSFAKEEKAELDRLRKLLSIEYVSDWKTVGVRILAWRLGANDFSTALCFPKDFSAVQKSEPLS